MKHNAKLIYKFGVLVLLVSVFGGCDWFKKKDTKKPSKAAAIVDIDDQTGPVIATVNGKEVKESALLAHEEQMKQMNPYLRGAAKLPNPLRRKIFQNLLDQEVIVAWMDQNDIESNKEFLDRLEKMVKMVKRHLKIQTFEADIHKSIDVPNSEVKDYFSKNKDKFVKNRGEHGVAVLGVKFEKEEDADAFLEKAKGKSKEDFKRLAEDIKTGDFRDFDRVTEGVAQQGFMFDDTPKEIKERAGKLGRFPKLEKIAADKAFWVVLFVDRVEAEYSTFDEVKDQLSEGLKGNKVREEITKKLEDIKKDFDINVDEDYFKDADAPAGDDANDTPQRGLPATAI